MTREQKGFSLIAFGAAAFIAGIYGWAGSASVYASGIGLLSLLGGVAIVLSAQSLSSMKAPHALVWVVIGIAAALHLYENLSNNHSSFSYGWFTWALLPYLLVLVLACFKGTRLPALAGGVVALLVDLWTLREVFIDPKSSTASLALIWMPLWNMILFVPIATLIAWAVSRRRQPA